jgi:hypothetical protein
MEAKNLIKMNWACDTVDTLVSDDWLSARQSLDLAACRLVLDAIGAGSQ